MEMELPKSKFDQPLDNEGERVYQIVKSVDVVAKDENPNWSVENLKDQMLESLGQAGNKALEKNQGTIYVTLSGGVDSSLGLAILRQKFPDARIVAFTMGGSENHPDVVHARMAAEKFNAEHRVIVPGENDIADATFEFQKDFPEAGIKQATAEGNFDVYLLYKYISKAGTKLMIAYDGIDELMGGYWGHRKGGSIEERKKAFGEFWNRLIPFHLRPLLATSKKFGIDLVFPYLDKKLAQMISEIPVQDRVSDEVGKLPMRKLAEIFEVPEEIIKRSKRGQVGMMEVEDRRK